MNCISLKFILTKTQSAHPNMQSM